MCPPVPVQENEAEDIGLFEDADIVEPVNVILEEVPNNIDPALFLSQVDTVEFRVHAEQQRQLEVQESLTSTLNYSSIAYPKTDLVIDMEDERPAAIEG